jgi:hypothetical protein
MPGILDLITASKCWDMKQYGSVTERSNTKLQIKKNNYY